MSRLPLAALATAALGLALVPLSGVGSSAVAQDTQVTMSGTAYEFNSVHTMLAGATVHVLEDADLTTTVAADGTYSLDVPDQAEVTPYITDTGYATIYLQTFTTDGQDLVNVNFQTPTITVRNLLEGLLKLDTDPQGYPAKCAVVTTVSTKQVRGVTYDQFIDWGAHGVAGVQASIEPTAGNRTYFNANVIPDPTVTETSKDGGVVWTDVPDGDYTLSASGAGSAWPDVHVSCAAGRIINANPPWGLNQLATTVPTAVKARWGTTKQHTPALTGLTVAKVPHQVLPDAALGYGDTIDYRGRVTVSCAGNGCFAPLKTRASMTKPVDLLALLGSKASRLKPGRTLSVSLAVPGYNARVDSWTIPAHGTPSLTSSCIPLGWSAQQPTC